MITGNFISEKPRQNMDPISLGDYGTEMLLMCVHGEGHLLLVSAIEL